MLITDSQRYTSVLVFVSSMISRKGLVLLSYDGGEVNIDTPSIIVRICGRHISHLQKTRIGNHAWGFCISRPLYVYLRKVGVYTHYKFQRLRVGEYIPQMLFVGAAGCGLLPPMQYISLCDRINICDCRIDYSGELPTGITLL